ncbi:hypothetical protein WT60_24510 [Burkholderia sp. MSMB617WGS]|nr:hypothetical protein WT60_24510 [Burkholderia sp. MSMB617WGS]
MLFSLRRERCGLLDRGRGDQVEVVRDALQDFDVFLNPFCLGACAAFSLVDDVELEQNFMRALAQHAAVVRQRISAALLLVVHGGVLR